jgi:Ca2+-binding RTX toxin-like protein
MGGPVKASKIQKLSKSDDVYAASALGGAVDGRGGNDVLVGSEADDKLIGGRGNDILRGGSGNDILVGGRGDDFLQGFGGSDVLTGGAGADTFWWHWSNGPGDRDVITDFNRAEGDKISLPSSRVDIAIRANLGWLLVDGAFDQAARMRSEEGQIVQVANADGTYTLRIYYSGTTLSPTLQHEIVVNTKLIPRDFDAGYKVRYPNVATEGDDHFLGSNGADIIYLLGGNDSFDGLSGFDEIHGGAGDDVLRSGDPLARTSGGSKLFGDEGNDLLIAGSGQDFLDGGDGNDILRGNGGGDLLYGGTGDDVLDGGRGGDVLSGGAGADRFVFSSIADSPTQASFMPSGDFYFYSYNHPDLIVDFNPAKGDVIDLRQLDVDPAKDGVQTANWVFAGASYDPTISGPQMTISYETIFDYAYDGASSPRTGTILSLYLDDGDDIPDFQVQLNGIHLGSEWVLI